MKRFVLRRSVLRMVLRELMGGPMSPQAEHVNIDGHDVVEVTFTAEQVGLILKKAAEVHKDPNLPNKIGGPFDRWFTGFLGQVAFFIYAFDDFERGYSQLQSGYKPDNHDCIFRGWNFDVKTRGKPWHDLLMIPQYQWAHHHDYYIGCRLQSQNPYVVQIWGYATREEFERVKPENAWGHGLTRAIFLKDLHPIIELKDLKPKSSYLTIER